MVLIRDQFKSTQRLHTPSHSRVTSIIVLAITQVIRNQVLLLEAIRSQVILEPTTHILVQVTQVRTTLTHVPAAQELITAAIPVQAQEAQVQHPVAQVQAALTHVPAAQVVLRHIQAVQAVPIPVQAQAPLLHQALAHVRQEAAQVDHRREALLVRLEVVQVAVAN